jgi:TonB family protein
VSSGISIMGQTTSSGLDGRRDRRYTIAVPVDVVALRSGVPASIPGRTLNMSVGGIAMVLAGELSAGEPVGVQFQLPSLHQTIQAKAVVRHYSLMQCGLQFLAMPAEQEMALRTWAQMADFRGAISTSKRRVEQPTKISTTPERPARSQSHGLRWVLMSAAITVIVLAVTAWWTWNSGWHDLERGDAGRSTPQAVEVSSSVMGQRIVHRADPIYPSEALKQKVEGQVMLDTLIGEDGTVKEVQAVSGPDLLRPAAVDAVKWWRFEPYQVDGRATPVHTLIEVDFRLSR